MSLINKSELNFRLENCDYVPCLPIEEGKYYFWNNFYVLSSFCGYADFIVECEKPLKFVVDPELFNNALPQSFIRFRASKEMHIGQIINSFIDRELLYFSSHMKIKESDMKRIGYEEDRI